MSEGVKVTINLEKKGKTYIKERLTGLYECGCVGGEVFGGCGSVWSLQGEGGKGKGRKSAWSVVVAGCCGWLL